MSEESKILGYDKSHIMAMQHGTHERRKVPPLDPVKHKEQILSDMKRFGLPVHMDVAAEYRIEFPADYELVGDTWVCNKKKEVAS